MFLVARRTKFRVVKQAAEPPPTPIIGQSSTAEAPSSNINRNVIKSNSTAYPQSSPNSPRPNASSDIDSRQSTQEGHMPPAALQPPKQPTLDFPDFSLNSYLCMAQGAPRNAGPSTSTTTAWAQQLHRDGVLQTSNQTYAMASHVGPQVIPMHPLTSTPLNPADVNPEDLNVYWEDPCKYHTNIYIKVLHQLTADVSH